LDNVNRVKNKYQINVDKLKELECKFDEYKKNVDNEILLNKRLTNIKKEINEIVSNGKIIKNRIEKYQKELNFKINYPRNIPNRIFGNNRTIDEIKRKINICERRNSQIEFKYKSICEEKDEIEKQIEQRDLFKTKLIEHKKEREIISIKLERAKEKIESKFDIYEFLENSLDNYFDKHDKEVIAYCNLILKHSPYNANDGQSWFTIYNSETKNLIIDYDFPSVNVVSNVKEVRYLKTRDEYKDVYYSKTEFNKLYDNMLYQITLLTIYELFISDRADALDSICFNGWLKSKNKATGHDVNNCILTIQINKTEFLDLDLKYVDPKECFKKLKGIANSKLHSVIPVAPIISINREDDRFVDPRNIQENLDESCNLAVMDWEDFEHLIREVFEQEFAKTGGEVKVTRSSRDRGVDAIAFDPDPIKGGKIVIQAKRYTNTVGVNAVRDLYGTLLNEGANKGILVTTSDYGPDAFEFAKGKPITLLNGGNLLNLLARNGHKARIDIKEAKQLRLEKEKTLFTDSLF